jgi:hypothetical protein
MGQSQPIALYRQKSIYLRGGASYELNLIFWLKMQIPSDRLAWSERKKKGKAKNPRKSACLQLICGQALAYSGGSLRYSSHRKSGVWGVFSACSLDLARILLIKSEPI